MASVARGHGGDGGGEPPHGNPNRIPNACESSQPKRRGKGKNLNLFKAFSKNKSQPLSIKIDDSNEQYRSIGENDSKFTRYLSSEIDRLVPLHYRSWQKVPAEYKRAIWPGLCHYFDVEGYKTAENWEEIKAGITKHCQERYKDRKSAAKTHFKALGGYNNIEEVRRNPPPDISPEGWNKLIDDLYQNPKYKNQCQRNSLNRAKHRYKSRHGSQSYAQKRYLHTQETGTPGYIEVWRRAHCKDGVGWENEASEQDWEKIQEEYAKMHREADGAPVDETECLKRALGTKRGYIRGVGRTIKTVTPDISSSSYVHVSEVQQLRSQLQEQQINFQDQLREQERKFRE